MAGQFKDSAQGDTDPPVWMTPFIVAGIVCLLGAVIMTLTVGPKVRGTEAGSAS